MSGEKTELPTPKRLRKAREDGQVPHSKDLTQTVLVVALFGYLLAMGESIFARMGKMLLMPVQAMTLEFNAAVNAVLAAMIEESIRLVLPFLLIVLILGLFAELAQTGMLIAPKVFSRIGKRLNVVANVKNIFSMKNLFDFLKSIAKITLLSVILYVVLDAELPTLLTLPRADIEGVGLMVGLLIKLMVIKMALGYAVIAIIDFFWQRRNHIKQLKMSKHEVQQDYKESEGDPHIKYERRNRHVEMLHEESVERARNSSVVVTNPIHLAICLYYIKDQTQLPVVVAKGEGALARRMVHAAREAQVPVVENVPLAWSLHETTDVMGYIPSELIEPVGEVLRMVRVAADTAQEE
jgi:type III secretion protein U